MTAYEFVAKVFVLVSCLDPRLSLPEISSFQRNSKFFFLTIPIYARARRTLGSLARASSQSTYRKLARHVRCPLHSRHFFLSFFCCSLSRRTRLWEEGKKMWVASTTGAVHNIFPCLSYTKEFVPKFKRDFFCD